MIPHIVSMWTEWHISGGQQLPVRIIVTDLQTQVDAPDFDSGEFDDFMQDVLETYGSQPGSIVVRPVNGLKDA